MGSEESFLLTPSWTLALRIVANSGSEEDFLQTPWVNASNIQVVEDALSCLATFPDGGDH